MNNLLLLFLLSFFTINSYSVGQEVVFTTEEQEWIKNHPTIEFGYEPNWEPYEIYENGEYKGIVGEYVKILSDKTGIKITPIPNLTWEKSLEGLKNGTIKMVPCCAVTEERSKFLEFTNVYLQDPAVITTTKDYNYVSRIEDFEMKTMALPKDFYITEVIKEQYPKINVIEYPSVQECLEALTVGNADAYVGSLGVTNYYLNNKGFSNLKVAAPTNFTQNGITLATTKDWVIFRDIAQKVFNSITVQEKTAINEKWITQGGNNVTFDKRIFSWIFMAIGLILIVFVVFVLWNRSLKKQIHLRTITEEELRKSLDEIRIQHDEKKILLQEVHHRVKNNLQIVTSLMRLHLHSTRSNSAKKSLQEAVERIKTISLIHEKIYRSDSMKDIEIQDYMESLFQDNLRVFSISKPISFEVNSEMDTMELDKIVPLALIVNELLTNSLKYAFEDKDFGEIEIQIKLEEGLFQMMYSDNGTWVGEEDQEGFGTSLIEVFTEQLDGLYERFINESGTSYTFKIPM